MLDPGNAQHMATYPTLSFPKHIQHSLATTVEGPPPRTETPRSQRYSQRVSYQKKEPQLYKHIANTTATNYSYYLPL